MLTSVPEPQRQDEAWSDEITFTEAFERSKSHIRTISIVALVAASVAIVTTMVFRHTRKVSPPARQADPGFVERFESLYKSTLYPVVWTSGHFTKSVFEGDFQRWTLTIASSDWQRRSREQKLDLATTVWTAFRATTDQAGGDSNSIMLRIVDEKGDLLAEVSTEGARVLR